MMRTCNGQVPLMIYIFCYLMLHNAASDELTNIFKWLSERCHISIRCARCKGMYFCQANIHCAEEEKRETRPNEKKKKTHHFAESSVYFASAFSTLQFFRSNTFFSLSLSSFQCCVFSFDFFYISLNLYSIFFCSPSELSAVTVLHQLMKSYYERLCERARQRDDGTSEIHNNMTNKAKWNVESKW